MPQHRKVTTLFDNPGDGRQRGVGPLSPLVLWASGVSLTDILKWHHGPKANVSASRAVCSRTPVGKTTKNRVGQ